MIDACMQVGSLNLREVFNLREGGATTTEVFIHDDALHIAQHSAAQRGTARHHLPCLVVPLTCPVLLFVLCCSFCVVFVLSLHRRSLRLTWCSVSAHPTSTLHAHHIRLFSSLLFCSLLFSSLLCSTLIEQTTTISGVLACC